jgi:4-amino-4-deoxy-L-arabinose transferase-like glycosyltransferase
VCLFRSYIGKGGWGTIAVLGLSVGFAGLTKGPVVLGVLVMTIVALIALRLIDRRWPKPETLPSRVSTQPLRPLRMILKLLLLVGMVALVVGPWLYAIEKREPGYTLRTVWQEVFVRAGRAQEGHKGPPGFYLLLVWVTFFPWSLLLPAALVDAWRHRHVPAVRFAVAAIVGPWVMFELVATKLPHYALPTYAPLAYLVARVLIRSADGDSQEFHQPAWPNVVAMWAAIVAIVGVMPWAAAFFFHPLPWQTYVALGILSAWSVFFAVKVHAEFARRYPSAAAMWMGLGTLGYVFVLYTWVFPVMQPVRLSERVAAVIPDRLPPGDVIMIDYKEPSLAFYEGGSIREQRNDKFLEETPPEQWPNWVVLTEPVWRATSDAVKGRLDVVGREKGWNYADGGRIVEVLILKKR